jgi:sigma-E factor negative regulatory protein RseA
MDGECSEAERLATERALAEEEVQCHWWRYHLIGEIMRGEVPRYTDPAFALRVSRALATEPTVLRPGRSSPKWARPVAGAAIAASVAMVAVLGVRNLDVNTAAPTATNATVAQAADESVPVSPTHASTAVQPVSTQAVPEVPVLSEFDIPPVEVVQLPPSQSRLNSYLVNYSEQRAMLGSPAVLPYVKVVGYESTR